MISFHFHSLRFKPVLTTKLKAFVKVEFASGLSKVTEPSTYNPANKDAIFSESFDFHVGNASENSYFTLSVYELNETNLNKSEVIAKKTIQVDHTIHNETLTINFTTKYASELKLSLTVIISDPLLRQYELLARHESTPPNSTKERSTSDAHLDILSLAPLLKNFVESVGPLVRLQKRVSDLYSWKNPSETLAYAILFSLFYIYHGIILPIFFLVFFKFCQVFVVFALKKKPNLEKEYKKNLVFIQNGMQLVVKLHDYYITLFNPQDRSTLVHLMLQFKRVSLILAVLFIIFDSYKLFLLGFWGLLLYNTRQGRNIIERTGSQVFKTLQNSKVQLIEQIDKLNIIIQNTVSLDKIIPKDVFSKITSPSRSDPAPNKPLNEKSFAVYENQRWWLGVGWSSTALLGDYKYWSDVSGKRSVTKDGFPLPEGWQWDGEWAAHKGPETDADGWEYSSDFKGPYKPTSEFAVCRRRKWVRKCSQWTTPNSSPTKAVSSQF